MLAFLGYALVGLILLWYTFVGLFAFQQELGVGWQNFHRKPRMLLFVFMMMWHGTLCQFAVYGYYLLYGEKAGRQFGHRCMCAFYGWFSQLLFGPMGAEGLENLPAEDENCIYISNHQSSVDFALYYALPHAHFGGLCAVAKESIMFMPGFGAMTALCGGIMIRRGKKGTMQQLVEKGNQRLNNGINVGLFPQGTRGVPSEKKAPLDFKLGFVIMAAKVTRHLHSPQSQSLFFLLLPLAPMRPFLTVFRLLM